MAFFTVQCKSAIMMDLPHKEDVGNTQRTNTLGTITSMKNPTSLRLKLVTVKATELRPMIARIQVKPGEFFPLTCQTTLLKSFYPGLPAVVGDVKVIAKHTNLSANV